MTAGQVVELSPADVQQRRDDLVALLADAIEGGASVNYVLPFRREDLHAYWDAVASDVRGGARTVLAIIDEDRVKGSVQLVPCRKPNQPHRADVEKLLVHSTYRQRGAGTALMSALEHKARDRGRWLLTLDTRTGSTADALYVRWGWQPVGRIPDYALDPDGTPAACTFYWKRLT
jgi:GNAT superfamily N-acetyltransferase